jgi:hypothetical protein
MRKAAATAKREAQRVAVGRQIFDVQRSHIAFDLKGRRYLSRTLEGAMSEAEHAYGLDEDYDRAAHLARVAAFLVHREAMLFKADPQRWITRWKGLRDDQGLPAEGIRT